MDGMDCIGCGVDAVWDWMGLDGIGWIAWLYT